MSVGQLATGLITLGTLIVGVNAVFVMRREFVSKSEDHERRIGKLEELKPTGGAEFLEHARRNADHHVVLERQLSSAQAQARSELHDGIGKLHDKISTVDRNVTALEVETRVQSKTLNAIAEKLNVHS